MWLYLAIVLAFLFSALFLLVADMPKDICDRPTYQFIELFLRIFHEGLCDIIEAFFGPNARIYFARFWINLPYLLPFPPPKDIKVHNEKMKGVRVRCYAPLRTRCKGALVWLHGGGWVCMKPDYYDRVLFWFVKKLGVKVFAIDYRLAPDHPHPAGVNDCCAAIEHLYDNCNDYGIDGNKIAVCGDSAGGNLAAVVSQRLKSKKIICCQVLVYPLINFFSFHLPSYQDYYRIFRGNAILSPKLVARCILMYMGISADRQNVNKMLRNQHISKDLFKSPQYKKLLKSDLISHMYDEDDFDNQGFEEDPEFSKQFKKALDPSLCPIFGITEDLPPALVLTCGYDVLRDEGIVYHHALRDAGVKSTWVNYPGAYHGILNLSRTRVPKTMAKDIAIFLSDYLS